MLRLKSWIGVALTPLLFGLPMAGAQDYPSRSVRLIVPFGTGGVVDTVGRLYAQHMSTRLGQTMVVENRTGASGNIGTEHVARSAPDGHTLLLAFDGTMVINPNVYPNPGFDPIRDFAPISKLGNSTQILVANPSFTANSLTELIARKGTIRNINYGTSGAASPGHVSGELLKQMTAMDLTHVPYKGGAQAVADVMGGQIPMAFTAVATARPLIAAGKLKGIAVTTGRRSELLPNVQTFLEAGLKDFVVDTWMGIMAPAKTPPAIINRLHQETVGFVNQPEIRQRLIGLGVEPVGGPPDAFARQLSTELARWAKVVKDANIKLAP